MSHLDFVFSTYFVLLKNDLSGNKNWSLVFEKFAKIDHFGIFDKRLFAQNVARFIRNVE